MNRRLTAVLGGTARLLCYVAMAALFALMMGVTVVDVVARWFGLAVPGAHELVTLGMRMLIPLALPYVFWIGSNVAVEMLTEKLPPRAQRIVKHAGAALGMLTMAYLTVAVTQRALTVWEYGEVSSDLAIPLFLYWIPLIIGCGLSVPMALYLTFWDAPGAPAKVALD
jgi:TRAP-type C4-dicarboxylate transport system permease small subunit